MVADTGLVSTQRVVPNSEAESLLPQRVGPWTNLIIGTARRRGANSSGEKKNPQKKTYQIGVTGGGGGFGPLWPHQSSGLRPGVGEGTAETSRTKKRLGKRGGRERPGNVIVKLCTDQ